MRLSQLQPTARLFGVSKEEASDPDRVEAALARVWVDRGLSFDEIREETGWSDYQIETILKNAGYTARTVSRKVCTAPEMAGVV